MQSPRPSWPPPAPARGQPVVAYFKRAQAPCYSSASPKNGDDKTYSYLTVEGRDAYTTNNNRRPEGLGQNTTPGNVALTVLLLPIVYHTLADMIAGTLSAIVFYSYRQNAVLESRLSDERRDQRPCLVFPGCGCYVFWQLGMVQFLARDMI